MTSRFLSRTLVTVVAYASVWLVVGGVPVHATDAPADDTIDAEPFVPEDDPGLALLAGQPPDPHGLVPYPDDARAYTLGIDTFEVWECPMNGPVPMSADTFVAQAEIEMSAYFEWLSSGRYDPRFIVGGAVPEGKDCADWLTDPDTGHALGTSNAALFVRGGRGGFAGPGLSCAGLPPSLCSTSFPQNRRMGYVGMEDEAWSVVAHEIGHMLSWPHSNTLSANAAGSYEYDNAIDVMSGNYNTWKVGSTTYWGTYAEPYATVAYNRYAAGWIDPSDVVVWNNTSKDIVLRPIGGPGTQMAVIDVGSSFYVLDLRRSSTDDPFPDAWNGVEVHSVARCGGCFSLNGEIAPTPAVPFSSSDLSAYTRTLPHVLEIGDTALVGNAEVTVSDGPGSSLTVSLELGGFLDVALTSQFREAIEWLADEGITRGCNPPTNTKFCPKGNLTRGQLAAFFTRTFGYTDDGGGDLFVDDDLSEFESDIDKLATAGVTKGCNPPANDRFCHATRVTRGQFAAFMVRAMGYTDDGGGDLFKDDDESEFEADIDKLARAGVTKGCNPPVNDEFCPNRYLTREEFAALLYRALG